MKSLSWTKNLYIALTIVCIAGGALLLIWPRLGLNILCRISGIFMLVYGVAKISSYFTKDLFQLAFQFDFGLGIVALIMGIMMLFKTAKIVDIFSFCVGIFLFVDSALKIQTSLEAKRFGIEKWYLILILSIISGIVGVCLLFSPSRTAGVIVRLVGLGICLNGVMNLVVVLNTVRIIENAEDGFLDDDIC